MSAFSMLSSIGGHWPFSYCQDIGQSAVGALRTLKSAFSPTHFSAFPTTTGGISLLTASANHFPCQEKLGWVIQTRFHFGSQLTRYVGVSILVKNSVGRWSSFARASGLVLLVGVGSYFAYRLCLKLFGCRDLASLLHCLYNGNRDEKNAVRDQRICGRCRRCNKRQKGIFKDDDGLSYACSSCGGSGQKMDVDGRTKEKRRRLYLETNQDEIGESSSGTSESVEEQDDENPTEMTDLASECSDDDAAVQPARVDAKRRTEEAGQSSTATDTQRRRWRNSARKKTNALDDPNGGASGSNDDDSDDEGSVTGFSKSRSPPPIPRFLTKKGNQEPMTRSMPTPALLLTPSSRAHSVKSISVQSVPSSQQFIWDPICTPGDEPVALDDELLTYFADVPTGELVQRFLDGLFLSSDQNRTVSPGPSEAASEFSLAADRQLGDGTAEHFERLQYDMSELRTDVDEFDAELTTYMHERRDCLKSDSRVFYRSVVVDDNDETSAAALGEEDCATPSASPPSSPEKERKPDGAAKLSPCRRLSNKRHRKSHESSNGSSSNTESNNNRKNENEKSGARSTKRRRKCSEKTDGSAQNQERHFTTEDRRTPTSCNEKSALSLDTGYVSSYHTHLSSADSGPCSPSSAYSIDDEEEKMQRIQPTQGAEMRPTRLDLPSLIYTSDSMDRLTNLDATQQPVSDESGKPPSSFFDSLPSSSSCGLTPDDRDGSWRKRSPSALSLEWEDEIFDSTNGPSPSSSSGRSRGGKNRLKALDLMEFLRVYYNVDNLEAVPKIYQIGRKLTNRGYRRVLLFNDLGKSGSIASTKSTPLDNLIVASLIGTAHFRWAIFKCHSFRIVPEAVDVSMKRCSFFAERCSMYFGSTTAEGTRAYILQCMQKLWQLHESVQRNELEANIQRASPSSPKSSWALIDQHVDELIDGMKVLMALRSLETYEEILFTRRTPFPFYTDLFRFYTPASYAEQRLFRPVSLSSAKSINNLEDLDIALLADTLGVRIEMFRPNSPHPESVAVYPELEHNANWSRPRLPILEPSTSDGLFLPLI